MLRCLTSKDTPGSTDSFVHVMFFLIIIGICEHVWKHGEGHGLFGGGLLLSTVCSLQCTMYMSETVFLAL